MIKISTICVSKNCETLVEETIASFALQDLSSKEIIFIDSKSEDKTVKKIKQACKEYNIKNYFLSSEIDDGISNAMNKGWKQAKGQIVNFLHFGDKYATKDVLDKVVNEFEKSNFDFFSGAAIYNYGLKNSFYYYPKNIKKIYYANTFAHMAVFIKRDVKDKLGLYDESLLMVMDYDFWFRAFKFKYKFEYSNNIFVKLMKAGQSSKIKLVIVDFINCKKKHFKMINSYVEKLKVILSLFIIIIKVVVYGFKNNL